MNKKLIIEGMTCGHCAARVEKALKEVDGVTTAKVDLGSKTANVELEHDIGQADFAKAIEEAGYTLVKVE